MVEYNIAKLFEIAFGIKSVGVYNVDSYGSKPNNVNFNYSGLEVIPSIDPDAKMSYLGTPIVFPVKFKGKKYQVFNDQGDAVLQSFDDFDLPAATLVRFRRPKIKTKTLTNASKGSVKEIFAFNDWQIDIRGLCLRDPSHPNAQTAFEQKTKLYQFDTIVDSIQVIGKLFNDLDISHLTIDEIVFDQLKGKPGVIPFYMRCSSDEPLDLEL